MQKDGDVFGDGVNIAARLQALAKPDTICISQKVYEEVAKKLDWGTVVSLGKPKLKNITERFTVQAYADHFSNGNICEENEGAESMGVRVGYRF